ncbi:MAG: O-antigen ligase family protein [Candidatus Eremiobacteraeota bacterium]|nr:O-antigen ligase family protein [Candidatus Eremiobacteraeota bacterium]
MNIRAPALLLLMLSLLWPCAFPGEGAFPGFLLYALLVVIVLGYLLMMRNLPCRDTAPVLAPLALFLAVSTVSAVSSLHMLAALREVALFALYTMAFYCALVLGSKDWCKERAVKGLVWAASALSLGAVARYGFDIFTGHGSPVRAMAWFPSPNLLGAAIVLLIPLAASGIRKPFPGGVPVALMSAGLVLTMSRSSLAGITAAVLFYYAVMRRNSEKVLLALSVLLVLFCGILLLPSSEVQERFLNIITYRWDLYALMRFDAWKSSLSMWLGSPLCGIGPGNFQFEYPRHALEGPGSYYLFLPHAHSLALQLLVETGVLGVLTFAWWAFAVLRRSCRRSPFLFLGLAAYFFHSLFDYTLWYPPVGFLFFLVAGLAAVAPPHFHRSRSTLHSS